MRRWPQRAEREGGDPDPGQGLHEPPVPLECPARGTRRAWYRRLSRRPWAGRPTAMGRVTY